MSTISKEFTKEQLIEHLRTRIEHRRGLIANMHIDRGYRDYLKLELRSSEIALASLEAETVAYIRDGFRADGVHFCGGIITAEEHERTKPALSERYTWKHQPLYTAPPATVSVPDGYRLQPISEYDAMCAAMLQGANGNSPVITDDVRRMDWLVSKTVDVREPMVYGSHSLFWSQTITDEEDEYHATKLREQIDAAMEAEQAAAPQQEVK